MTAPTLLLATDFDGTFRGGTAEQRRAFYTDLAARADVLLVYVTGRDIGFVAELIGKPGTPRPHYVIGDVGTSVYDGATLQPMAELKTEIAARWRSANARVTVLLEGESGLALQPTARTDYTKGMIEILLAFERLLAHYRVADICLTTPRCDGLNLVAKEYVAANRGQTGVLLLSEFAGCAVELPQAVLTNPYFNRAMDLALDQALDMPAEEARKRMEPMNRTIHHYDVVRRAEETARQFDSVAGNRAGAKTSAAA